MIKTFLYEYILHVNADIYRLFLFIHVGCLHSIRAVIGCKLLKGDEMQWSLQELYIDASLVNLFFSMFPQLLLVLEVEVRR